MSDSFLRPAPQPGPYPLRSSNRVDAYLDGARAFAAISDAIDTARVSVWGTVAFLQGGFRFPDGRDLFDLLDQAGRRGVDVRLLCWRSFDFERREPDEHFPGTSDQLAMLDRRKPALSIRWDRGVGRYCQHQKSWLIDAGAADEIAFVGGINLDRASLALPRHREPGETTHDLYASVRGPAVRDVAHNFVQRWQGASERELAAGAWGAHARGDLVLPSPPRAAVEGTTSVQIQRTIAESYELPPLALADGSVPPARAEFTIRDQYLAAIAASTEQIYIENQAILGVELLRAIHAALDRGVHVFVVVPERPFEDVARARSDPRHAEFFAEFARLEGRKGFCLCRLVAQDASGRTRSIHVHSKLLMVDDHWLTIGSANAMERSFLQDTELNLAIWDVEVASSLRAALLEEFLDGPIAARHASTAWSHAADAARANARRLLEGAPPVGMLLEISARSYHDA